MEKDAVAIKVVVVGGSAGSLEALLQVLTQLSGIPYALVVVMHRRSGDDVMLEDLLSLRAGIPVDETNDKTDLLPGRIFIAPANYHLLFEKDGRISLDLSDKYNFSRPSIDITFESAADAFGPAAAALLLSGANSDGTAGLRAISRCGGVTAVQDPDDAAIPYMPEYARTHATPDHVLKTQDIANWLRSLPQ